MSADVARGHGGDGGGEDRHPPSGIPIGGCYSNKGKGRRKPNQGGRGAGRLNTRDVTRNKAFKARVRDRGKAKVQFETVDQGTLMPVSDNASHWASILGEYIRQVPMYYDSWEKVPDERKAFVQAKLEKYFDLAEYQADGRWDMIRKGIRAHATKMYNNNKHAFKTKYWIPSEPGGSVDVEAVRARRPPTYTPEDWELQIQFWDNPKNRLRAEQNKKNRAKNTSITRQGSRSIANLRHGMMNLSTNKEYPSLVDSFYRTHTIDGVFPDPADKTAYDEMMRLKALGTEDVEIMRICRPNKMRGHITGVGRVVPGLKRGREFPTPSQDTKTAKRLNIVTKQLSSIKKSYKKNMGKIMSLLRCTDTWNALREQSGSQSQPGGPSGSGVPGVPEDFVMSDDDVDLDALISEDGDDDDDSSD